MLGKNIFFRAEDQNLSEKIVFWGGEMRKATFFLTKKGPITSKMDST